MLNNQQIDLNNLEVGKRTKICSINPSGSLIALKISDGTVKFSLRYTKNKKDEFVQIGVWNPKAPLKSVKATDLGYSITAAVRQAEFLSHENNKMSNTTGLTLKQTQNQKIQEANKLAKEEKEKKERAKFTFKLLLDTYLLTLPNPNAKKNVGWMFNRIPKKLLGKQANLIVKDDIVLFLSDFLKTSTRTVTNNLNRYMCAAFNKSMQITIGSESTNDLRLFNITTNPCAKIKIEGSKTTNKNPLLQADLKRYAEILSKDKTDWGAMLRIHLYTGGLRIEQLCRLTKQKLDLENKLFTLKDEKQKPAREYSTPIPDFLRKDFEFLLNKNSEGDYLFSPDKGKNIFSTGYLTTISKIVVGDKILNFTLKRIRSGHTTLMGFLKILPHVKNHLQSHGFNKVIDGAYDSHDYYDEKLEALNAIHNFLNPPFEHLKIVDKKAS